LALPKFAPAKQKAALHLAKICFTVQKYSRTETQRENDMSDNEIELTELEERLMAQRAIMALLIAELDDAGIINKDKMRGSIDKLAEASGFGARALHDIEKLFGMVDLTLQMRRKRR
jgi:hypothetical protein